MMIKSQIHRHPERSRGISSLFLLGVLLSLLLACEHTPLQTQSRGMTEGTPKIPLEVTRNTRGMTKGSLKKVPQTKTPSKPLVESCQKILKQVSEPLKELTGHHSLSPGREVVRYPFFNSVLRATLGDCANSRQSSLIKSLSQLLTTHSNQVGVILPLSGEYENLGQSILKGLKAASKLKNVPFASAFIVKDNEGTRTGTQKALADLLFENNVSIVVGGVLKEELSILSTFAQAFSVSTLILNRETGDMKNNSNLFRIYPDEREIAKTVFQVLEFQGVKTLGILRPQSRSTDRLITALKTQNSSIKITIDVPYTSDDYESMDKVLGMVAGIDRDKRQGEFKDLFEKAKKDAEEKKQAFDVRSVILPARPVCEALLVPDQFRRVHQVVKLLKYHGVEKMTIVGNQEWRSVELFEHWDDFLQRAFFVDSIGSYDDIPQGLQYAKGVSSYFVQDITSVDFQLMGYRAARISLAALSPAIKRKDFAKNLLKQQGERDFFTQHMVFHKDRTTFWPAYALGISEKSLNLMSSYAPTPKRESSL